LARQQAEARAAGADAMIKHLKLTIAKLNHVLDSVEDDRPLLVEQHLLVVAIKRARCEATAR
jgi:hypothetical protein